MFGDDPDPSVTTDPFGFGQVSDAHTRGLREVSWFDKRGMENPFGLGTANKSKGDTATTSGCKL